MIVILGIRDRQVELSSGQFYCPKCDTTRQYKHKRAARYFTLFFIPLFQIETLGEFVECQSCRQTFSATCWTTNHRRLLRECCSRSERNLRQAHLSIWFSRSSWLMALIRRQRKR